MVTLSFCVDIIRDVSFSGVHLDPNHVAALDFLLFL